MRFSRSAGRRAGCGRRSFRADVRACVLQRFRHQAAIPRRGDRAACIHKAKTSRGALGQRRKQDRLSARNEKGTDGGGGAWGLPMWHAVSQGCGERPASKHFQCGPLALQTIRSDVLRKKCGCPLTLAGPAVPPPRVSPLAKATRSKSWRGAAGVTGGRTAGKGWRSGEAVKKGSARRSRRQAKKAPAVVAGGCRQEVFLPDRPALVRKLW